MMARALTELPQIAAKAVLIAAFDAGRVSARIAHCCRKGRSASRSMKRSCRRTTADIPRAIPRPAELRHQLRVFPRPGRTVHAARLGQLLGWLRRKIGSALAAPVRRRWHARWRHGKRNCRPVPGGFALDSREVRARFGLPAFTGQLLMHAIGAAGHDVVKYALDTFATDNGAEPVLHARRQRLAIRPLCRPARPASR